MIIYVDILEAKEGKNQINNSSIELANLAEVNNELTEANNELTEANKKAYINIEYLTIEVERLKHHISLLKQIIYGQRSEKLNVEASKAIGVII